VARLSLHGEIQKSTLSRWRQREFFVVCHDRKSIVFAIESFERLKGRDELSRERGRRYVKNLNENKDERVFFTFLIGLDL